MLFSQNFSRGHDGSLAAVLHGTTGSQQTDNCLAAADITLQQAVHGYRG